MTTILENARRVQSGEAPPPAMICSTVPAATTFPWCITTTWIRDIRWWLVRSRTNWRERYKRSECRGSDHCCTPTWNPSRLNACGRWRGVISLPLSPTKLFVNTESITTSALLIDWDDRGSS